MYLIKLFPEITIKSRPVRRRFIRQLRKNLREVLKELDEDISVTGEWDALEIETSNENPIVLAAINDRIASTPGIANIPVSYTHLTLPPILLV